MTNTFSLLFYIRRDKKNKKGQVPIYVRVTVNGQRAEIAVKRYVDPEKWLTGNEAVNGKTEAARNLNHYIDSVRAALQEHHHTLIKNKSAVTAQAIKDAYFGNHRAQEPVKRSLFELFEDHNDKMKALVGKDYALGTYQRYITSLKLLREYVLKKYGKTDYHIEDLDQEFVTGFDHHLRTERRCANNTVVKYVKNIKKIVAIALSNGWLNVDPFLKYKTKLKKVDRGYLTQQELDAIRGKKFSMDRVQQVADAFIFQCHTGLAYADIKKLKHQNIVTDDDGQLWVKTTRTKTGNCVEVPLLPEALAILDRYRDCPLCSAKGVLLPVLSNQKMNAYLKEIADLCHITKNLSSHLGRHSFATTITLSNGVSLEALSRMLGHGSLKYTQVYGRILNERVAEEMKTLKLKMELKKCVSHEPMSK